MLAMAALRLRGHREICLVTDESTRFNKFVTQLYAKLEAAKDSRGITCPICNQGKWDVVGADTVTKVNLWPDYPRQHGSGAPQLKTIPIVCQSCGFVAHFAVQSFDIPEDSE